MTLEFRRTLVVLSLILMGTAANAAPILKKMSTQGYEVGSIVISYSQKKLYLILDGSQALIYPVAVPKSGKVWYGVSRINGKFVRPDWAAPEEVAKDKPNLRGIVIPGGAPNNPMGQRAMTLEDNAVTQQIAIHGVAASMESSIGTAASYGCIRMRNPDIIDLFDRVNVGTLVEMVE